MQDADKNDAVPESEVQQEEESMASQVGGEDRPFTARKPVDGKAPGMIQRLGCIAGVIIVVVLGFMVLSWLADAVFGGSGIGEVEEAVAVVPESCLGMISLSEPIDLIEEVIDVLEEEAEDSEVFGKMWEELAKGSKEFAGFDATDAGEWEDLGFDLSVPMTAAIPKLDGRMEPVGMVVSVGVDDEEDAVALIKRIMKKNGMKSKDTEVDGLDLIEFSERDRIRLCAAIKEDRLFLMAGDRRYLKASELADHVEEALDRPMADNEVFEDTLDGLGCGGTANLFVNLRRIRKQLERPPEILGLVDGFAAALTDNDLSAFLLVNEKDDDAAEILDLFESGSKCRSFLEKLNEPYGAVTFSIEDPLAVFMKIATEAGVEEDEIKAGIKDEYDMSFEELGDLLKDGSGGIAFYAGESLSSFGFVGFLRINDEDKAASSVAKISKKVGYKKVGKVEKPNVLFSEKERWSHTTVGVIDEYIVFGWGDKANGMLTTLARDEDLDGWDAEVGGTELLAAQFSSKDLSEMLSTMGMQGQASKEMKDLINEDTEAYISLDTTGDGFLLEVEYSGEDDMLRDQIRTMVRIFTIFGVQRQAFFRSGDN